MRNPRRALPPLLALGLASLLALPVSGGSAVAQESPMAELAPGSGPPEFVVARASAALVERMEQRGVDVHHSQRDVGDGQREINAIMTPGAQDFWAQRGVTIVETDALPTQAEVARDFAGRAGTPASLARERRGGGSVTDPGSQGKGRGNPGGGKTPTQIPDGPLNVLRADVFTTYSGTFVSVEVWSDDASDTVRYAVEDSATGTLSRFRDAGQYMYHRTSNPVAADGAQAGDEVVITDDDGSTVTATLTEWLPGESGGTGYPAGYRWAFVDGYVDAFQSRAKIRELAAEFPDLAEIVALPEKSSGYRRPAMASIGTPGSASNVWAETLVDGHEGGDGYVLETVDPGAPSSPLSVTLDGRTVRVSLGTDAAGTPTSSANEVAAAINASPAGAVVKAWRYFQATGNGVVPVGTDVFDDDLAGPADPSDPVYEGLHEPFAVEAIRIGKVRDGSKPGVFAYSQEHAREWVTPLVALETAERLLRNYGSDPRTTELVDNLDIFVMPSVNPDGTNVSMWDDLSQRKNFRQYCEGVLAPYLAHSYTGVDLNRNFTVGSRQDGYDGSSDLCYSAVYSPAEQSEPEARNEVWLTETFPNIDFSMNTHSYGGYFMWSPGSYIADGRIPLPRPSLGTEEYFWSASADILSDIKQHRGTVVQPGRTGPTIDVLYSAAGNSADEHYYADDADKTGNAEPQIFGWNFEVGVDTWDAEDERWRSPGAFWPDYESEGFDQAMEFANGWMGFLGVALEHSRDTTAPTATPNVTNGGWYSGATDVVFETSEPADVHYTTDGSTPTLDSPVVQSRGLRDGAEPVEITRTTVLRWIAVDASGNQSAPRRAQVRIR